MRKTYPYLQDSYILNSNKELKRREFLQKIDEFANQRQYIRITLLTWEEEPIKALEGIITSGSINKDGSSPVRRTCQLSCSLGYGEYDIQQEEADFALNKKIFLEIGIKNDSDDYLEYPILWFPQGIFFISSFGINSSTGGAVNVNISLKDKMAMLNGDVGGTLPALVVLDTVTTQLPTGEIVEQKVPIYNIIQELVNHYGGEQIPNIVIEDIDLRIRKVMRWIGDVPLYLIETYPENYVDPYTGEPENTDNGLMYRYTLTKPTSGDYWTFNSGDDVGYILTDFVVPEELTANAGESVVSVLDKIVQLLGNYEYFYDEFGIFHFREIKNYKNTTQGKLVLAEVSEKQYLIETNNSKSVYTFTDTGNITSINVTPQYDNIKNDFIILGSRQSTVDDTSYEVRYHLAIDEKPEPLSLSGVGYYYNAYGLTDEPTLVFYSEKATYGYTGNIVAGFAERQDYLPEVGEMNSLYHIIEDNSVYYWNGTMFERVYLYDSSAPTDEQLQDPVLYYTIGDETGQPYYAKDWRTKIYLDGQLEKLNGTSSGVYSHYYEELIAGWPTVYSLIENCFYSEGYKIEAADRQKSRDPRIKNLGSTLADKTYAWRTLTDGNYYLDFINASTSSLGAFSVDAIGRRTDVVQDEKINCLFQPEIPNINILNIDEIELSSSTMLPDTSALEEQRKESSNNGQPYCQVGNEIYSNLSIGGYANAAFDQIKYELYLHTRYQKQVSITALPAFYLEPNSRITINEKSTNTYGDYVINTIGITLGPGANMAISANEIFERE